ncbi:MAG: BBP7 family outer membrane beta-barrel protein [Pirellulaceae bacterium]|nr:BBP7 family outer membrane beta-barrel protein [Pirellulaceae bacterium]
MKAVRSAVGILFVVFASNPCMSAMAQSPEQQAAPVPSIAEYKDAGLDDCRPYWNDACPSVYAQVDALFMTRQPRFAQQPMVVGDEETTLLSTSDLDFDFEPGVRATVGIRHCGGRALEFSYFDLGQGDASAFVEGEFLTFPGDVAGNVFPWMDSVGVNYSSWLHNFELNLPCCSGCCESDCGKGKGKSDDDGKGYGPVRCRSFEWFAGFRYIDLGERLNIVGQGAVDGEQGSYNLRTTNHMYGAQLGARLRRSQGSFGWEATGKAGIFGNDSQQRQSVTDFPDFTLRNESRSGGGVAFVGEVNVSALVRLTDVWNIRTGYNAMWIEGLALAPDQLDFDFATDPSGNQLRNGGGMFLHGVNVGLEARW